MKKYIHFLFCFLLLFSTKIKSQLSPIYATEKKQIIVETNASILSTAIPLEITNKFLFGGFISDEMKSNSQNKHKTNNYLGIDAGYRIQYLNPLKKTLGLKNSFWGIDIGSKLLSFNDYSMDLHNLIFYGNEPYAGQTLNFNDNSFTTQFYHHLGMTFGTVLENIGNGKLQISATPSYLMGINYNNISINNASILTEEFGENIQLSAQGQYASTDTSAINYFSPQGQGVQMELNLVYETEKSTIGFSIEDLGLITWDTKINYNIDTSFTFNGVEIQDIFNIQDTILTVASFQESLLKNSPKTSTSYLPTAFKLYYEYRFNEKYNLKNWVQYRLVKNYIPFVMTQLNYNQNNFTVGASAAYGGYANLQAGLVVSYDLKVAKLQLGSNNILGFISAKNQTTQNIFARLNVQF